MMPQEWFYLFLMVYGFISLMLTVVFLWIWIDNKIDQKRMKDFDFEVRLHRGDILHSGNIFEDDK